MNLRRKLATARRLGLRTSLRELALAAIRLIWIRERLVVFRMVPQQLNAVVPTLGDTRWIARSMNGTDFISSAGKTAPPQMSAEFLGVPPAQRVHWLEVGGQIASWGFSTPVSGDWPLVETRSRLVLTTGSVCLTSFETVASFRGHRLYPTLLTRIIEERFGEGYSAAYIWCRESNQASYRSIKRVGFREVARHDYARLFGVPWRRERALQCRELPKPRAE